MEENIRLLFASNLKSLLAKNEKTQADMVKYMKISSATASDWCNGKKIPRTDKLQSLCAWLDCELGDLIGERTAASNATVSCGQKSLISWRDTHQWLLLRFCRHPWQR